MTAWLALTGKIRKIALAKNPWMLPKLAGLDGPGSWWSSL